MEAEEILGMKAGRELSALVAVNIMGLKCAHLNLEPLNPHSIQHANGAKSRCIDCGWKDYNSSFYRGFKQYSVRIQLAWDVVEKMSGELFSVRSAFLKSLHDQTYHEISGTGEKVCIAWPDVFWYITPETICKAALIAKQEGIDDENRN